MGRLPEATRLFEAQRPRLLRLAYRMLSSVAEAQDVVQDAWLRWQRADVSEVQNAPAFLTRIVTRLCLDAMKSARAQRETYIGSWLPDPLPEPDDDLRADNLTLTLMLALERLSPLERAAFLLHDVFDTPMDEIAATLDRDVVTVRQLASRARRNVQADKPRYPVARDDGERIAWPSSTRQGQAISARSGRSLPKGSGSFRMVAARCWPSRTPLLASTRHSASTRGSSGSTAIPRAW